MGPGVGLTFAVLVRRAAAKLLGPFNHRFRCNGAQDDEGQTKEDEEAAADQSADAKAAAAAAALCVGGHAHVAATGAQPADSGDAELQGKPGAPNTALF